jgi:hypothetical protein
MSDLTAGSSAVRGLQQNVLGAQYDAANIAAAAEETQLKLQQDRLKAQYAPEEAAIKLQQDQAALEKTKLDKLVTETNFKESKEAKEKLQALTGTEEFKKATPGDQIRMMASVEAQAGNADKLAAHMSAAETLDAKEIANKQKTLDQQSQLIGDVYGVLSAMPDSKVEETFSNLPEANRKALIAQVGEANWNRMSPTEKKEATKNLMLNAKGQMAKQLKEIELEKQKLLDASRERIAVINANARIAAKSMGGGDREMRDWNIYTKAQETIEKSGQKTLDGLNAKVDAAQAKLDKAVFFKSDETADYNRAVKARDDFKRSQLQKELNLAVTAPNFPGKQTIIDNLKKEMELFGGPEEEKPATTDKAAPAKDATSNKGEQSQEEQAMAWAKANPNDPRSKEILERLQGSTGTTTEQPKADTKKYIRSKGARGLWDYTESPRGMTKAQWEKLDKKKE